jgi:8-oxo-dGTP pyrophosphatase MutT (NUDIX family)
MCAARDFDVSNGQALTQLLSQHTPGDPEEEAALDRTRQFLASAAAPLTRQTVEGHITAAAVVMDGEARALLLFHATLGMWLQPGGHVEPDDTSVAAAALREAREETGLPDLALDLDKAGQPRVLDIDAHRIPENPRRREPAHWHYDICYVARTRKEERARIDPMESHALRWVTRAEVDALPIDPATRRRLLKAFRASTSLG